MPVLSSDEQQTAVSEAVEISARGKWMTTSALRVGDNLLLKKGKYLRLAVVHDEEWLESEVRDPELCLKSLRGAGRRLLPADIFTFAQKLPATVPQYSYPVELESVAAARTASFKEWWEGLPQETRKNVRRAQKRGVVVSVRPLDSGLIKGIAGVNDDSNMRQGLPNAHFGKSLEQVEKDHAAFLDRSEYICAHVGDELIGFLKIVYRGNVAAILQLLPKASHADKRPANALVAKAVEQCEARGISHLTYGLYNYGNKRESSLREFKIRNGFEEILVPRYYVPITPWGALCIKCGFHLGLHGLLPSSVISFVVKSRAKWYSVMQSMGRCSSMVERLNRNRQMERSIPPAGSNS